MTKHWQLIALFAAIFLLFVVISDRDRALIEKGKAQERVRTLDSALSVAKRETHASHAVLMVQTDTVTKLLTRLRTDTLPPDTVYLASDTLKERPLVPLPAKVVDDYRALTEKCSLLNDACLKFQADARRQFALYEERLKAAEITVSCRTSNMLWGAGGVLAGYLAGRP
jgi:hypothetical protein